MGVIGTFGSFTAARMGIYASQASLNVTGNNIANINTVGYCRQNMDLVSLRSGGSDRYSNAFNINIGYGVLCTGVSQSRDPYLDIRFRTENANVGAMGAKLSGLNELSKVLDEVGLGSDGEGVLEAQFNTIYEQMEILSRNVGSEEYDTLVRSSCDTLCQLFNTYSKELSTIKANQEASLMQDVKTVNTILDNIRQLNEQIRTAGIYGDKALELRDQRNLFIDKLSSFVKIDATYTTEPIDEYSSVEKLVISLADSGKPAINLVDGIYATQFSIPEKVYQRNPDYDPNATNAKMYQYTDAMGVTKYIPESAVTMVNGVPTYKNAPATTLTLSNNPYYDPNSKYEFFYKTADGKTYYVDDDAAAPTDSKSLTVNLEKTLTDKDGAVTGYTYHDPMTNEIVTVPADAAGIDATATPPTYTIALSANVGQNGDFKKNETTYTSEYYYQLNGANHYVSATDPNARGTIYTLEPVRDQVLTLNPNYDAKLASPYLDANGNPTMNEANAAFIHNYAEDASDNRYLFQLAALTDKNGRYMKDKHNNDITQSVDLSDTALYGALQSTREILTEKGEFSTAEDLAMDPDGNIKRGIPYYQKALDALAQKFADTMNKANGYVPEAGLTGVPGFETETVTLNAGQAAALGMQAGDTIECYKLQNCTYTNDNQIGLWVKDLTQPDAASISATINPDTGQPFGSLEALHAWRTNHLKLGHGVAGADTDAPGGNLFSTGGDTNDAEDINAGNISVSKAWSTGDLRILCSKIMGEDGKPLSTANENINHMISLMTTKMDYVATDTVPNAATAKYFNGTFQEFFAGMTNTLAADTQTTTSLYNNYDSTVLELDNDRSSVSGVDLNEEATNMMQYQKSYSAACRLLTTIDSMLDKLINGTAI